MPWVQRLRRRCWNMYMLILSEHTEVRLGCNQTFFMLFDMSFYVFVVINFDGWQYFWKQGNQAVKWYKLYRIELSNGVLCMLPNNHIPWYNYRTNSSLLLFAVCCFVLCFLFCVIDWLLLTARQSLTSTNTIAPQEGETPHPPFYGVWCHPSE